MHLSLDVAVRDDSLVLHTNPYITPKPHMWGMHRITSMDSRAHYTTIQTQKHS